MSQATWELIVGIETLVLAGVSLGWIVTRRAMLKDLKALITFLTLITRSAEYTPVIMVQEKKPDGSGLPPVQN